MSLRTAASALVRRNVSRSIEKIGISMRPSRPELSVVSQGVLPVTSIASPRWVSALVEKKNAEGKDGGVVALKSMWDVIISSFLALVTSASLVFSMSYDSSASTKVNDATASVAAPNVTFRPSRQGNGSSSLKGGNKVFLESQEYERSKQRKPYDISVRAIRGGRFYMEDEFFVANGGRFAAVFDGHGGSGVSKFLKQSLYNALDQCLQDKHWEEWDDAAAEKQQIPSVSCYVAALRAAFEQIERDVLEDDNLEYQGSTAVAVVLHESEEGHRTLLSANVGDSRAVLSRKGRAVDLTHDHKPNDEKEKKRIMALGETIEWDQACKVHRVRNLSLSRSIGDRYAKPAVSAEVEIQHFPVMESEDEFVIIASDGLWDVMTSHEAVSFVHHHMEKELAQMRKDNAENYRLVLRKNMAKFLAREAIRKGSSDNVCVLMVWF